jgi:hypothetical protein
MYVFIYKTLGVLWDTYELFMISKNGPKTTHGPPSLHY